MRYLVISDVHANLAALEAVLDAAEWDELLFLGDAIQAGPSPAPVLDVLDSHPGTFLEGNHDRDPFDVDPTEEPDSPDATWLHWTRQQLEDRHVEVIESFAETRATKIDSQSIRLHHGDFDATGIDADYHGRLWPDSEPSVFEALADRFEESVILHGHSHIQFDRAVAGTRFVNPGSVGAPRLGRPHACYAILENGRVSLRATGYDVERTCTAMDALPLDREFIDAWKTAYRTGTLPDRYGLRDFEPLRAGPYR